MMVGVMTVASKIYRNNLDIRDPVSLLIFPDLSSNANSMSLYTGRSFNVPMAATDGFDVSILSAKAKNENLLHYRKAE